MSPGSETKRNHTDQYILLHYNAKEDIGSLVILLVSVQTSDVIVQALTLFHRIIWTIY